MQNQNLSRENPKYRTNFLSLFFVALPLLVFAASSAYSVLALWRAKSLQALAAPEIQRLPFGMWVGNDITWAMKFAILSAGYFSLLLAYSARKQLWQNKAKLGILALLGAAQALLCLDYIAKLQWFADDGVTAKGLVIIGFTAINAFLLAIMRNIVKERMAIFFHTTVPISRAVASRTCDAFSFLFWDYPSLLWQKHRQTLMFLGGSFLFVLLMYGGKVFFTSYAADDYARFFTDGGIHSNWNGRWAVEILNHNVFFGPRHILPYFNTLWGLFVLVISAYLTARIWDAKNRKIQFGIICLAAINPHFAHNLFFNTNVTVPLSIFLAVLSVYILIKDIRFTPVSILLATFGIGVYQTVIQISFVIIIIWLFQQLERQKPYKSFLPRFFLMTGAILLAYLFSSAINDATILWRGLTPDARYADAKQKNLIDILRNAILLLQSLGYKPLPYLLDFYSQLEILLYSLFGLAAIAILRSGIIRSVLFILGIIMLRIVIDLPFLIFGVTGLLRTYMHVGWVFAGLFALLQQSQWRAFAVLSRVLCIIIFLFSALYISQFYDSTMRQTENDIRQANQIVNRIRLMPEYQKEPMPFLIVGEKNFPVTGQTIPFHVALNTGWSKYGVFTHFTDFNFRQLNAQEDEQIRNKLAARQDLANYPDKGSILFVDGTAVLILDKSQLSLAEENAKAIGH